MASSVTRVVGKPCRTTPALTPEQQIGFTGRPRSMLYRHLNQLRDLVGATSITYLSFCSRNR